MLLEPIPCAGCGEPFPPVNTRHSYCRSACRYRVRDAARASTPCAGGCGTLLHEGRRGSLPAGERTCRPCRRRVVLPNCKRCGQPVPSRGRLFCSRECVAAVTRAAVRRRRRSRDMSRLTPAMRKGRMGGPWRRIRREILAGTPVCHICTKEIDNLLPANHPMSATVDHLISLASGGAPLDRANLAPAHRICNLRKG